MQDYKELRVWQAGMELAEEVYRFTEALPTEERFGMSSQLRRAAVSVPSNISEGYCRGKSGEYLQFLRIARGSLAELETQLLLCKRLGWLPAEKLFSSLVSVQRQLQALISSIENR